MLHVRDLDEEAACLTTGQDESADRREGDRRGGQPGEVPCNETVSYQKSLHLMYLILSLYSDRQRACESFCTTVYKRAKSSEVLNLGFARVYLPHAISRDK